MLTFLACEDSSTSVEYEDTILASNLPDVFGYPVVSTDQSEYYDNNIEIPPPSSTDAFYGQDAKYSGNGPQYDDNEDGTITDDVTGLMWSQSADMNGDGNIDAADKMTYSQAIAGAKNFDLGGYNDWRLPTIKELYSLILFIGIVPGEYEGIDTDDLVPFIDKDFFDFNYGDTDAGERIIDAQYASSTRYVDGAANLIFGANFADGLIKGYCLRNEKTFFVAYVRGNMTYGLNSFANNGDSTITDNATGLMWMQFDSKAGMNWEDALNYAENLEFAGYSDWRLPDIKELQSIVDYTRSPATTSSAAIDPLFNCTQITNEVGEVDYPYYWSSTTHSNWSAATKEFACYASFGRAMGYINGWEDVHGAGAQRSDLKMGNPNDYPTGLGPQGNAIRINNYVRCVRSVQ